MPLYIGLMSGTSMDAVDAALVDIEPATATLIATRTHPIPAQTRARLHQLTLPGPEGWQDFPTLDVSVGRLFAEAALVLLEESATNAADVVAIGSHGQTVYHAPTGPEPCTLQLGDPNVIAERTGLTTVGDFRRRDVAAGGHGAPLAPAFHEAMLRDTAIERAVVNIGGIANLSVLPADPGIPVSGFDTGPGNVLMDLWSQCQRARPMDEGGHWAAQGTVDQPLLEALLTEPYFVAPPPKSTGRELFNLAWLSNRADARINQLPPQVVQRSLCELTCVTIARAISHHAPACSEVLVCGGGVHNGLLMECLAARLPGRVLASSAEHGLDPDWMEAMAFAWLASRTLAGLPGNLPEVTGARGRVVLGGIYPA
jgi:anhydro-N-acetylmuramic acid kinase